MKSPQKSLGLIFLHTTVTHDLYPNTLKDTVLPQLQRQHDNDDFFFQQDRAPPHYAVTVQTSPQWTSSFGVLSKIKSFHENHVLWMI
jgi:hypothetical protein